MNNRILSRILNDFRLILQGLIQEVEPWISFTHLSTLQKATASISVIIRSLCATCVILGGASNISGWRADSCLLLALFTTDEHDSIPLFYSIQCRTVKGVRCSIKCSPTCPI